MKKKPRELLIDGDILLYKFCAGHEVAIEWEEDAWTVHVPKQELRASIFTYIKTLKALLQARTYQILFSSSTNFRKQIYPAYKAKRSARKPVGYKHMKDWFLKHGKGMMEPDLEADDLLGILATQPRAKKEYIVVSEDKDLMTVPCLLFRRGELQTISREEAHYQHMLQTLVGDSTDNYPGCPGLGEKKAKELLDAEGTTWPVIVQAYEKKRLSEKDALTQAQCSFILTSKFYSFSKKKIRLWRP